MEQGSWKKVTKIGQGGFADVFLYKNMETDHHLAVKVCKQVLNARAKVRWNQEIELMLKISHPNVVRGLNLPSYITSLLGSLAISPLAMEYCNSGDLRKLLVKADNRCGFVESTVRQILQEICCAVLYLHSERIIHRDLKPENILIHKSADNKFVYKITDVGYAKQLDPSNSIANSFVGTYQYLAPELFAENPEYTKTVDYWSIGFLVFECICGQRPFFSNSPVPQMLNLVATKDNDDIYGYLDSKKKKIFSDKIPDNNRLSTTFKVMMENWFKLPFLVNASERGGPLNENREPEMFTTLTQILQSKVLWIMNVTSNKTLDFPVEPSTSWEQIKQMISADCGIEVNKQLILQQSGELALELTPFKLADDVKDDCVAFVFDMTCQVPSDSTVEDHPEFIDNLMNDGAADVLIYSKQRELWSFACDYCRRHINHFTRFVKGQMAFHSYLTMKLSEDKINHISLMDEYQKLRAFSDFFCESFNFDWGMLHSNKLKQGENYDQLKEMLSLHHQFMKDLSPLLKEVVQLHAEFTPIEEAIQAFQTNDCIGGNVDATLNTHMNSVRRLLESLLQRKQDDRETPQANIQMSHSVLKFFEKKGILTSDVSECLECLLDNNKQLVEQTARHPDLLTRIEKSQKHVLKMHRDKQMLLWGFIGGTQKNSPQPQSSPTTSGCRP